MNFEAYEAFPSQVTAHNSSLHAFLRAVDLEATEVARAAAARI
jgi:hypothetical protein